MEISGAQILIETLIEQGTDTVFGYPGGSVLNIYDALYESSDRIKHIIAAHEQGACHAADGYSRASGKVGVVIATSGPGATNLVTGIATAYLDSVPLVAITGNVPADLIGRDSFQEVDIVGITMPITKHNFMVKDVNLLADTVREAFKIAKSGRPGPVLIDITKNAQIAKCEYKTASVVEKDKTVLASDKSLEKAAEIISGAKRPYIYCGGGAIIGNAGKDILAFAKKIDAYIGCSMMGVTAVPRSEKCSLGMQGMHGTYAASKAMEEADVIIALGVRFSDRATGNKAKFVKNAKVIHIDVDAAEIDKNISVYLGIVGDVADAVKRLSTLVTAAKHPEWDALVASYKKVGDDAPTHSNALHPYTIIDEVAKHTEKSTPIVTDVGQHQMWVAQRYPFAKPRTLLTSGGLGTMGFGLGAAIGASVVSGKRTVLFTGDGCFGMNLNELATAVSSNLPVVVIIMNNGVLGMVRQWQTLFYNKHYSSTTLGRKTDFSALAKAFGAKGYRAENLKQLDKALCDAFDCDGPCVIDCVIDMDEMVLPMVPSGGTIDQIIVSKKEIECIK